MPMYEYRCNKCEQVFTLLEPVDRRYHADPSPPRLFGVFYRGKRCTSCGSRNTERILSAFTATASRSQSEMLNDLKSMGNVSFSPQAAAPSMPMGGGDGGACPSCGNSGDD